MDWLAVLRLLLSLANTVAGKLRDDQLRDDGASRAALRQLESLNEKVAAALAARRADEPGGLRSDDGHRRD